MVVLLLFLIPVPHDIQFILHLRKGKNILTTSLLHYFLLLPRKAVPREMDPGLFFNTLIFLLLLYPSRSHGIHFQHWWGFISERENTFSYQNCIAVACVNRCFWFKKINKIGLCAHLSPSKCMKETNVLCMQCRYLPECNISLSVFIW